MKLEITKIAELADATHPNNIEVGHIETMHVNTKQEPVIGSRFPQFSWWSTSVVREILPDNQFRTLNSIYKFKYIDE